LEGKKEIGNADNLPKTKREVSTLNKKSKLAGTIAKTAWNLK
jgi:hypothetical protein